MFCAELLGTTLMVTKQKSMLFTLLLGHLGVIWSILEYVTLVLESHIIFSYEFFASTFFFENLSNNFRHNGS